MQISLPPDLAREVDARVCSGRYGSPGEVVDEALRQLFGAEAGIPEVDDLDARIAEGLAELDRGDGVPGEAARERAHARLRARSRA